MAIMSLQTHIIHWRKLEKTHREMFSRTNYMEEDCTKIHVALTKILQNFPALAKANHISKYTLFVLFITNIKAGVKNSPSLF